jgi:hypothetical protein
LRIGRVAGVDLWIHWLAPVGAFVLAWYDVIVASLRDVVRDARDGIDERRMEIVIARIDLPRPTEIWLAR